VALAAGFGLDFSPGKCDPEIFDAVAEILAEEDLRARQAQARAERGR
jgi:hypothetical protein